MPVNKIYDIETVRSLIDRANHMHINQLKLVRNDVSNKQFSQTKTKSKHRNQTIPEAYRYPGARDVGHVFRHVDGTHEAGKSTYADADTAANVTCQILNSTEGQRALGQFDGEGRNLYDNTTKRVTSNISGDWYSKSGGSPIKRKISQARCELMKLGDDILWIHSSYPVVFQTGS